MMYPRSALIIDSYFSLRMLIAAFLRAVPNKLGGILITSTRVEIENNFELFDELEFMNLWIIIPNFFEFIEKNFYFSQILEQLQPMFK